MEASFTHRAYHGAGDLAAMQAVLAGWVRESGSCGYCHVGDLPHRIYNGLRGQYPRDEMIRLWSLDGQLVAFALVYPRHACYDAFVSPAHRSGAFERDVLAWAAETLRDWLDREGAHAKAVMTGVDSCDTWRANYLIECGYQPDETAWITLNEREIITDLPDVVLPEDYRIRSALGEVDAAGLAAVHSGAFGSKWTPDLYRDEVMRKPGYDPALEHVVVAPDGAFAAFCITWLDDQNAIGLFEPVGTHEAYQRKGLGRALMAHGLRFMQTRGMRLAQVGSEPDNPASNALYRAVGFAPKYTTTSYRKR
ncbi:MAG: GNAT family N-acetyltransferase [Anaerolineae bacterium]|nr:GNAT family N-acetyltransferase [Anaerolineae bacterium]